MHLLESYRNAESLVGSYVFKPSYLECQILQEQMKEKCSTNAMILFSEKVALKVTWRTI